MPKRFSQSELLSIDKVCSMRFEDLCDLFSHWSPTACLTAMVIRTSEQGKSLENHHADCISLFARSHDLQISKCGGMILR